MTALLWRLARALVGDGNTCFVQHTRGTKREIGFRFRGEAANWARQQVRAGRIDRNDWVVIDHSGAVDLWLPQARSEHRVRRSVAP